MAVVPASNRQLKVMRLFGMPIHNDTSAGQAGLAIRSLFADPANLERWNKYVYLTHDIGSESANLKLFDASALEGVVLPPGWTAARAEREHREAVAARILKRGALYDAPPPIVVFKDNVFLFTGRFTFGTRRRCERAVVDRGGLIPESDEVTHSVDYLVVGTRGSERWKHIGYGAKIEAAVVERNVHGKPAIIAEPHWYFFLLDHTETMATGGVT